MGGGGAFWQSHPVVGAVAAFGAWDLAGWVYHVIGHHTRVGWGCPQPHHSGPDFDLTFGLRQAWAPSTAWSTTHCWRWPGST